MNLTIFQVSGSADDCAAFTKNAEFGAGTRTKRTLVDTSSIVDGRIAGVLESGFLEGAAAPSFVLEELQFLADSAEPSKRTKGRDGLDLLSKLRESGKLAVVDGDYVKNNRPVDARLIEMAKLEGAKVISKDLNLRKVASLHGVQVLSIDELASALAPTVRVGDRFDLKIVKLGAQYGQGIAYLDDGSMVVVDRAAENVGKKITVGITNVTRTEGGRLLFAAPASPPEA